MKIGEVGYNMKIQIDLNKEYGLVLEGGGAKGAYQIGAWKALREAGVKIKGISGVSVGALNGALICMDDLDKANEIWENISYSQVMDVDDDQMDRILHRDLKGIRLDEVVQDSLRVVREHGMDVTPLRSLIGRLCQEDLIRNSPMDLYIVTYSLSDHKLLDISAKDVPEGLISDMLLASAYLPAFKREPLHGKHYVDGGVQDRVPLDSLIQRGYEDIIVLRINGFGVEKRIKIPENVHVIDIAPSKNLGGILEFESAKSRRNMKIGYYDAMKVLYGLAGEEYDLDMELDEEEAYERLRALAEPDLSQEGLRRFHEEILPQAGHHFFRNQSWTYKDLYIALLENTAASLRISRYAIYTEEELLCRIREKISYYTRANRPLPPYASFFE
jgi:NTE family protein